MDPDEENEDEDEFDDDEDYYGIEGGEDVPANK